MIKCIFDKSYMGAERGQKVKAHHDKVYILTVVWGKIR